MRSAVAAAVAVAAVIAIAACSTGPHPTAGHSAPPASASGGTGPPPASATPVAATARAPGCSTATAPAPALRTVSAPMTPVPSTPFGVAVTADGRWSFVALSGSGSVGVFRIQGPGVPSLARQVRTGGQPLGEALTRDGRYLLVADGAGGAAVISVSRAEQGEAGALLGTLSAPTGSGAIEVAMSPDSRFAFVSLEDSASIAVFNLERALTRGFGAADLVGTIPAGLAPVGMAVSPDGQWLYATSELALGARPSPGLLGGEGTLTVISVRRAETDPAASVVSTVQAGCSPVRVITSADGGVVWVTARESDRLLGFSAARLLTDPAQSILASVKVGEAPVGLALVDGGTRIVVADSNRFGAAGAASSIAVVNVAAALANRAALAGYLPAGGFPREMALEPGGRTLLVGNFASQQLEAVGVTGLP